VSGAGTLWIVKQYAVTPEQAGGTRQFDFAKELVKRGWRVVVWASSFSYLEHRDVVLSPDERWRVEEVEGVLFVWLRSVPYSRNDWRRVVNILHFAWALYRYGRRLPFRAQPRIPLPDAILAFSVPLFAPLAAYFLARSYRARFLVEVGDLWPQTLVDMGVLPKRHPLTAMLRALERFLYRRSRRIVVALPYAVDYLRNLLIEPERIVYLPNGVDLERFSGVLDGDDRVPDGEGNRPFTVMYVGAHGPANALDTLLEAAKILQERGYSGIRIVLVGDGQEKPRLQRLAREWRLDGVEFRGAVPRREVPQLLREADIAVFTLRDLPLYRYGISLNKLFDYMAAGRPVLLAGRAPDNPVEKARCGLTVPPEDPEALAEALLRLLQMPPEERKALGRRGREYVEQHHAIPVLTERLLECLEEGRQ